MGTGRRLRAKSSWVEALRHLSYATSMVDCEAQCLAHDKSGLGLLIELIHAFVALCDDTLFASVLPGSSRNVSVFVAG